jgi:biopolymer transport protein ExbD
LYGCDTPSRRIDSISTDSVEVDSKGGCSEMKSAKRVVSLVVLLIVLLAISTCNQPISTDTPKTKADTEPPEVQILSPVSGSTVSGVITVEINATDNEILAAVALMADGHRVGETLETPYKVAWDTSEHENGEVQLSAEAIDEAGNKGVCDGVYVVIENRPPESMWDAVSWDDFYWE